MDTVFPPATVSGLVGPVTIQGLRESVIIYNGLRELHDFMILWEFHIENLAEILNRHCLEEMFNLYRLHRREKIPGDNIILEADFAHFAGKRNMPTDVKTIELESIYGSRFKFIPEKQRFIPYAFRIGTSPIAREANSASSSKLTERLTTCASDVSKYLTYYGLIDSIGLEFAPTFKGEKPKEGTAEMEIAGHGTVVFPRSIIRGEQILTTSWPGTFKRGDTNSSGWQSWYKKSDGSRKVLIDMKILIDGELLRELARIGVLII